MTSNKRLVKVGDTVRLKSSDRRFSKLSYGEDYKVESIEPNNGYWDGSSYITALSDKNSFFIQLRMYENFFDITYPTSLQEETGIKFKAKGSDTTYTLINYHEYQDRDDNYKITWTNSSGESRVDFRKRSEVDEQFANGMWYWLDQKEEAPVESQEAEHTGGSVNYYKVHVANPTTLPEAYDAEANDIIESLGLTFAEGNLFKAIWRMAADRNGKKKKGNNSVYDAEKLVFFAERVLVQEKAKGETN